MVTLDDWVKLPEQSETLTEVVEGELLSLSRPAPFHQLAVNRLTYWLDERLALGYCALHQVEMVIAEVPLTVRVPDVVVIPAALVETNPARFDAEEDYENFGEQSGIAELEFAGTPLTIDLNALTTRRAQRL